MDGQDRSRRTLRGAGPGDDRARRHAGSLAAGLLASVLVHALLMTLSPDVPLPGPAVSSGAVQVVAAPPTEEPPEVPEVEVPPEPDPIRRPLPPVIPESGPPVAARRPVFIPHEVEPKLINVEEIQEFLDMFYPRHLRELGGGGKVRLWCYLDEQGRVVRSQIQRSSGVSALDSLALAAAPLMKYRPALNHGKATSVWVSQPIHFSVEWLAAAAADYGRRR